MKQPVTVVAAAILMAGCSGVKDNPIYGENGVIRDRGQEYAYAEPGKRLEIPPGLNAKSTRDGLQIPAISSPDVASAQMVFEAPRPEFFYASKGSEQASIRPLEGERVILVDRPIDQVWRELQRYWKDADINLETEDPRSGLMETGWIRVEGEDLTPFQRVLNTLKFNSEANEGTQNKLRVRVRPDPENIERTAISTEQMQLPISADLSRADWQQDAVELDYSNDILFAMLNYLSSTGDAGRTTTLSEYQSDVGPKAEMGQDTTGHPLLNIKASASEAWTLVNNALDAAAVDVGTRDQDGGLIYLTYRTPYQEPKSQSFWEWLRNRDTSPITFDFASLDGLTEESQQEIVYSSDPDAVYAGVEPTQEELQAMDGFKVWMGGKVVYVFGMDKQKRENAEGQLELISRFQLKFNRARSGVLISVQDDKGERSDQPAAEALLWTIKDNLAL